MFNYLVRNFKLSESLRLNLLLLAIFVTGGLTFIGFCWAIIDYTWQFPLILLSLLLIHSIAEALYARYPTRVLHKIRVGASMLLSVICSLFHITILFITILSTYLFVALLAFGFPLTILACLSRLDLLILKPETIVFIAFSLGSILCSNSYSITKRIIHTTPLRNWGYNKYDEYRENLANYLISPSNVTYLLYLAYFVFLVLSGFAQIESKCYLISKDLDNSLLKAFLVFIAFTNMRLKSKNAEINAKDLLLHTLKLIHG